jgi:hypothetical protein
MTDPAIPCQDRILRRGLTPFMRDQALLFTSMPLTTITECSFVSVMPRVLFGILHFFEILEDLPGWLSF